MSVTKYICLFFVYFLLQPFFLFSQNEKSLSAQAQKAFQSGNYALSATLWDSVHTLGYGDCASYFNAGNAYFRLHVPAKSLLNYERALRFCPENTDIYDNIQLVAQNLPDYQVPQKPSFLMRQYYYVGSNTWGIMAIIFANISLLLFYRYKYKGKKATHYYSLSLMAVCLLAYIQSANLPPKDNIAIVLQDSLSVKSEPGSGHKTIATFHLGEKVSVNEELGAWWQVESDVRKGWVEAKSIEKIMD